VSIAGIVWAQMAADLVLLHGFTQTGASWQPVREALAGRYRALTPDLPGHGAFAERPASFSATDAYLRAIVDGPYVLTGYSMGGRIALHAALSLGARVTRLVLIGASPGLADPAERAARRADDDKLADRIEAIGVDAFVREWGAQALFAGICKTLRSGGRLHAQCGGGPNLHRAHELAEEIMHSSTFVRFFGDWPGPWEFADAEVTAERLKTAGFVDIETSLEEASTTLATEADYREFVTTVIYHPHLERLPDASLKQAFIDRVTELAATEPVPFTLDYWRLNMQGRKP